MDDRSLEEQLQGWMAADVRPGDYEEVCARILDRVSRTDQVSPRTSHARAAIAAASLTAVGALAFLVVGVSRLPPAQDVARPPAGGTLTPKPEGTMWPAVDVSPSVSAVASTPSTPVSATPTPGARSSGGGTVQAAWSAMPDAPIPPRAEHTAVWTGSEMLVWGGFAATGLPLAGAAYDPAARTWSRIPQAPIGGRRGHSAIWTDTEMIVWGGTRPESAALSDGAAYDPARRQWRTIAALPVSEGRRGHDAVWTGTEMIVWGGGSDPSREGQSILEGWAYDPSRDAWRELPPSTLPARLDSTAVWTGQQLIVVTFPSGSERRAVGAAYDPVADQWSRLPESPVPALYAPSSIWTGRELLLLTGLRSPMGNSHEAPFALNAAYDLAAGAWRALRPGPGGGFTTANGAWTGDVALFPGWQGAAYVPATDEWHSLPELQQAGRDESSVVWTGSSLLLWGGVSGESGEPIREGLVLTVQSAP